MVAAGLRLAPPLPWMPSGVVGTPVIMIGVAHTGDVEPGMAAVAPLRHLGTPHVDTIAPRPFLDHQAVLDAANPAGHRYHWSSQYVHRLDDGLPQLLVDHARNLSAPGSLIALFHLGGAVLDGQNSSCAPFRSASFLITYGSHWTDPAEDDVHRDWTRSVSRQTAAHGLGGGYANFEAEQGRLRGPAVSQTARRRLIALKRTYDPGNVFHHNVNIDPDDDH